MALPVDPGRFLLFCGVMAVLAATPGPAVLFAVANGANRGRAGVPGATGGMVAAGALWFGGAAVGLGALMRAVPWLFVVLAWVGVAYVAWLGVGALRRGWRGAAGSVGDGARLRPGRAAWRDGFAVQAANPKMLLFFSSVLPPFLDLRRPLGAQMAAFAVVALSIDAVGLTAYGLGGAALADRLRRPREARIFAFASGALLLLAAALIASERLAAR